MKNKVFTFAIIVLIISLLIAPISLATNVESKETNIENKEQEKIDETTKLNQESSTEKKEAIENSLNNVNSDELVNLDRKEMLKEETNNNEQKETENQESEDSIDEHKKLAEQKNEEKTIEDGIYEICSSVDNSKIINISNTTYSNGTNINIGTNKHLKKQKFYIIYDKEKKAYIIKALQGNKVLDIECRKKRKLYECSII
ncbi:MAG: hypothetical protein IKF97_05935 [Clostridia bacterium]|nr:hypothetical protein [Clostridia bacterium]MBR3255726.1 hypothetical protein [Clostridia bacterium]